MASTKISALTTDTAPHRTNDFAPTYDASAVATKKVALKLFGVIPLIGECSAFNPADATTYYLGCWGHLAPVTSSTYRRIYIPRTGIITAARVQIAAAGAASAETSTMSIRLNDTTDTTISSSIAVNSGTLWQTFSTTSLTISVTGPTDYIEIKWVTPTWATNPTGVIVRVEMLLE